MFGRYRLHWERHRKSVLVDLIGFTNVRKRHQTHKEVLNRSSIDFEPRFWFCCSADKYAMPNFESTSSVILTSYLLLYFERTSAEFE